jgi:hypothetical protein
MSHEPRPPLPPAPHRGERQSQVYKYNNARTNECIQYGRATINLLHALLLRDDRNVGVSLLLVTCVFIKFPAMRVARTRRSLLTSLTPGGVRPSVLLLRRRRFSRSPRFPSSVISLFFHYFHYDVRPPRSIAPDRRQAGKTQGCVAGSNRRFINQHYFHISFSTAGQLHAAAGSATGPSTTVRRDPLGATQLDGGPRAFRIIDHRRRLGESRGSRRRPAPTAIGPPVFVSPADRLLTRRRRRLDDSAAYGGRGQSEAVRRRASPERSGSAGCNFRDRAGREDCRRRGLRRVKEGRRRGRQEDSQQTV